MIPGIIHTFNWYPELSGDERRTSQMVADKLRSCGIIVQINIGGYGVVGILNGNKRGKTIAWRADMDACAMQDTIDKSYKSRINGIKHVCGHDAHTAIALGIAETLASIKEYLGGTNEIFERMVYALSQWLGEDKLKDNAGQQDQPKKEESIQVKI